ncbi:YitT family protein [Nakamurella flavida]|uniref:YitT family protein n=1 Tax=Nakamurella flavida TaxID=363630 RepID=A0A938YI83_9ACTN|nr:YitT family protein [Nakamurella flavida]MBM9475218.1 YitT family protein [Nakamurella flavida]MDP9776791.1 uncharacterized membrane-anchored protein YitT (DUF2179 family) [Nakamurella flavida]
MSASTDRPVRPVPARSPLHHSVLDDTLGLLTGTVLAALGLFLLTASHAVTGGTAGVALLVSYATPLPFGALFFLVNLPFFVLAVRAKGWAFTVRSAVCVAAVSVLSALLPSVIGLEHLNPVVGVLLGNLLVGVALLVLFRHHTSLGGFGILALVVQERTGWRAGYVQMALDVVVVLTALAVVPPGNVLISAAGAIVLNLVLALNHRPGRYQDR